MTVRSPISRGTVDYTGSTLQAISSLEVYGTLTGSDDISVTGPATLAGTVAGAFGSKISFGGPLTITSNAYIYERDVTLAGTTTWNGGGTIYTYGDVTLTNAATGVLHIQPGLNQTQIVQRGDGGQPLPALINAGIIAKETDNSYASFDGSTTNTGTISVDTGTLYLGSAGHASSSTGTLTGATDTLLSLSGGWNITGPVAVDKVEFNQNTSTDAGTYTAATRTAIGGTVLFTGNAPHVGHLYVGGTADFSGIAGPVAVKHPCTSFII